MTEFHELDRQQQIYVRQRADALGVRLEFIDIDRMLEHYKPPESAFDRERKAHLSVATYRRQQAEKAGPLLVALPSEADVEDFAKKFGVMPAHVRTAEQDAAEKLAAEQLEQFETASEAKDTFTLTQIGDDKDHPHWADARRRVAEYFPSYDSWRD